MAGGCAEPQRRCPSNSQGAKHTPKGCISDYFVIEHKENTERVSMPVPQFGGPWTQRKLEVVGRYLDLYATALKNRPFKRLYIDAFAGTGDRSEKRTRNAAPARSSRA